MKIYLPTRENCGKIKINTDKHSNKKEVIVAAILQTSWIAGKLIINTPSFSQRYYIKLVASNLSFPFFSARTGEGKCFEIYVVLQLPSVALVAVPCYRKYFVIYY